MEEDVLEDYLNKFYEVQRPQVENIDLSQLFDFVILIFKNQSQLYRRLYNGLKNNKVKLDEIVENTNADIRAIFTAYDLNQNNFIEYEELRELLIDLGHDTMFIDQPNAEEAFEEHVQQTWLEYDLNQDGYISFEEFIQIHAELIDN